MIQVKAHTLTFTLPASWAEVTLAQALVLLNEQLTDRQVVCLLSGVEEKTFRSLPIPTLIDQIVPSILYVATPLPFESLPVPQSITLADGRVIDVPAEVDLWNTGQRWDVEDEIKEAQELAREENPDLEEVSTSYLEVARSLLAVALFPAIGGKKYEDIEQARSKHFHTVSHT